MVGWIYRRFLTIFQIYTSAWCSWGVAVITKLVFANSWPLSRLLNLVPFYYVRMSSFLASWPWQQRWRTGSAVVLFLARETLGRKCMDVAIMQCIILYREICKFVHCVRGKHFLPPPLIKFDIHPLLVQPLLYVSQRVISFSIHKHKKYKLLTVAAAVSVAISNAIILFRWKGQYEQKDPPCLLWKCHWFQKLVKKFMD